RPGTTPAPPGGYRAPPPGARASTLWCRAARVTRDDPAPPAVSRCGDTTSCYPPLRTGRSIFAAIFPCPDRWASAYSVEPADHRIDTISPTRLIIRQRLLWHACELGDVRLHRKLERHSDRKADGALALRQRHFTTSEGKVSTSSPTL